MEANANKYTWVWAKSTRRYKQKLQATQAKEIPPETVSQPKESAPKPKK